MGENPNTAAFRYILLIDPTDTEAAVSLMYSLSIQLQALSFTLLDICDPKKIEVCCVGDFAKDTNELSRSEVVLKVKTAMALGKTVILINSPPIQSSFYDVFNRHFAMLPEEKNEGKEEQSFQYVKKSFLPCNICRYYANVAIGSFR